jgi:hypothetical protein
VALWRDCHGKATTDSILYCFGSIDAFYGDKDSGRTSHRTLWAYGILCGVRTDYLYTSQAMSTMKAILTTSPLECNKAFPFNVALHVAVNNAFMTILCRRQQ